MRIFMATPNLGTIRVSLDEVERSWERQYNLVWFRPQHKYPVSYARNHCVDKFLKSGYDVLFFVDADTVPPVNALGRLLKADKDVISAQVNTGRVVNGRLSIVSVTTKNDREYKGRGVEKIDNCGMACTMIKRRVFEIMKPPWFTLGNWNEHYRSEDFRFCEKARELGFKVYADYDIVCRHYKEAGI